MAGVAEALNTNPDQLIETIRGTDMSINSLVIDPDQADGSQKQFWDVTMNSGQGGYRDGQCCVRLPEALATILPGSALIAPEFVRALTGVENEEMAARLEGNHWGSEQDPALYVPGKNFSLRVMHGSLNSKATQDLMKSNHDAEGLSEIAARPEGFDNPNNRLDYQYRLYQEIEPILAIASDYQQRIVEDCIATGETIVGVIAALQRLTQVKMADSRLRVDVAVATTQGILVLQRFAEQNNLQLELNVGHLAYGLSEGVPVDGATGSKARVHANYLTYPPQFLARIPDQIKAAQLASLQYVVGDMGDAAKGVDAGTANQAKSRGINVGWNDWREDPYGDHTFHCMGIPMLETYDSARQMDSYFTNGGFLMLAFVNYYKYSQMRAAELRSTEAKIDTLPQAQNLILSAKRACVRGEHDGDQGDHYAVVLNGISQQLWQN